MSGSPVCSTKLEDLLSCAPGWDEADRAVSLRQSNGSYQYFFSARVGFSDNDRITPGSTDSLLGALQLL